MYFLDSDSKLQRLLAEMPEIKRRQDLPPAYIINGAIYIARIDWLIANKKFIGLETVGYVMPKERSLDIDTIEDFNEFLGLILQKNKSK
jgi:N-acylneuraminate cytidylyltransferase